MLFGYIFPEATSSFPIVRAAKSGYQEERERILCQRYRDEGLEHAAAQIVVIETGAGG